MSKISDRVSEVVLPYVEAAGCSLWDVEYIKEGGIQYLRVFIDKDGGVSINDCENISRTLDPVLDELDIVPVSYTFEVSSPGIERVLKKQSDFEKFYGELVEIKLFKAIEGSKVYVGKLSSYSDGDVTAVINNNPVTFPGANIAQVRTHADF